MLRPPSKQRCAYQKDNHAIEVEDRVTESDPQSPRRPCRGPTPPTKVVPCGFLVSPISTCQILSSMTVHSLAKSSFTKSGASGLYDRARPS
jgi:hypothetical protein